MAWSGHLTIDPSDIESRFSEEDGMAFMDSIFSSPSDEDLEKIEQIRGVLDQIPPREADFVDLYYFRRLKQTDIARIFGVSQPTVCYRLQRATIRIRFLLTMPQVTNAQLEDAMRSRLKEDLDVQIMVLMWETTCQSEVAKRLGVSQGLVRHRFIRSIDRMQADTDLDQYTRIFRFIADNLNILREVRRSTWGSDVSYIVD